jgi:hypothetical protein
MPFDSALPGISSRFQRTKQPSDQSQNRLTIVTSKWIKKNNLLLFHDI